MADKILSVSQINNFIKRLLEGSAVLKRVVVEGEVADVTLAASGHLYFSLKDSQAKIKCVMWRSSVQKNRFFPQNGDSVRVTGQIQVYVMGGTYQIVASKIEKAGIGDLYLEFERRKQELEKLGWFEKSLKKPLPETIQKIGVVTSASGAAIHDIITAVNRRNPTMEILLAPASVQGPGAPEEIEKAIQELDQMGLDVLIVGRGGGSQEDLNAFNQMPVLEAIHQAKTPVISAVGHETDILLSDFVADLRAPTPTAAAELVSLNLDEIMYHLDELVLDLEQMIDYRIEKFRMQLSLYEKELMHLSPMNQIERQKTDIMRYRDFLTSDMQSVLLKSSEKCSQLQKELEGCINEKLLQIRSQLQSYDQALNLLNPQHQLAKGWVYVSSQGKAVTSRKTALKQSELVLHFMDGDLSVIPEKKDGKEHNQ